jgi:hypothetical protein
MKKNKGQSGELTMTKLTAQSLLVELIVAHLFKKFPEFCEL